ncbi:ATP-binding cassette domain-containing protein [Streptomyces sp. MP131-18]|uniref:ATP-binding cassette domain-containing protein n=1 Tax=Streptomyces sp. MP131-18 TaxID=1857892 RepID=UPI00097BEBD7|nr:ATP-binding cassette domain-containing protein [Streptomyces sp. MP131-18]ONK12981.1 Daunorubicin/doxorubicin resistance ATP-binding protein DrrA [Streptomyces sp. MP131-18]
MSGPSAPAIRTEELTKVYGRGHKAMTALDGIDLTAPAGAVFGLLGHNGAGKSTLLRLLSTLAAPTSGRAWVGGHDVVTHPADVRAAIGITAQQTTLDGRLSGRENLFVFGRLYGLSRATARRTAGELLERYDLAAAGDRPVSAYSGGMRRRLDIASSLLLEPAVLFLDEPTTGLDPHSRTAIWKTVKELAERGTTVLLTTQYLEEADHLAERVAVLDSGRVIADDTPRALKRRIGLRLSVTLASEESHGTACGLLSGLGVFGLPAPTPRATTITGSVAAGTLTLPSVLAALNDAGVDVADIGLHEPTLDEAYLALTGGPA